MTRHLSEKGWMGHMHHQHTVHMLHPIHWLHAHPVVQALLMAGLIVLLVIGLGSLINSGVRQNTFNRVDIPATYPFGPVY